MDGLLKPMVLITGFGPFEKHPINASWEAVKLLPKESLEKKHNIELVTIELPVTYENVDEFVPALWETHEPRLMIHVGVSAKAEHITLETVALRKGYTRRDYFGRCPIDNVCYKDGPVRLHTKFNIDMLCSQFNEEGVNVVSSNDAGRYVCEYTYYKSLYIDSSRTLFVHVPPTDVIDSQTTSKALEKLIELCLNQLESCDLSNSVSVSQVSNETMEECNCNDD